MILILKEDRYNRDVAPDDILDFRWSDLVYLVENPMSAESKDSAPCFYPFNIHTPRLYKSSIESLDGIILDIDYDYTIEEFTSKHSFAYVLYSSFSHTEDHHKFRVIIPLKKTLPFSIYDTKYFRAYMKEVFPFNDEQAVKFMGFVCPIESDTYRYHINKGNRFDFDEDRLEVLKSKFEKIDKYKEARRVKKDSQYECIQRTHQPSVEYNEKVQDFLSGKYRTSGGNLPLFTALAVCRKANDVKTKELVIEEALRGGWAEYELTRKLNDSGW